VKWSLAASQETIRLKVQLSLEGSAPIFKDYPVDNFKARAVIVLRRGGSQPQTAF